MLQRYKKYFIRNFFTDNYLINNCSWRKKGVICSKLERCLFDLYLIITHFALHHPLMAYIFSRQPLEIQQHLVAVVVGHKVGQAFHVAVDGVVNPVAHATLDVHIPRRLPAALGGGSTSGLAITHSIDTPYHLRLCSVYPPSILRGCSVDVACILRGCWLDFVAIVLNKLSRHTESLVKPDRKETKGGLKEG